MNFKRGVNAVYNNDEKLELAKVVEQYNKQYDEEVEKKSWENKAQLQTKKTCCSKT